jgi:hypothetical protein
MLLPISKTMIKGGGKSNRPSNQHHIDPHNYQLFLNELMLRHLYKIRNPSIVVVNTAVDCIVVLIAISTL